MSKVIKKRITLFFLALVWLPVYGGAVLHLLFLWIAPEQKSIIGNITPKRQYIIGDNEHLLWQRDNIIIEERLFTINKTNLLAYSNRTPTDGYLTTIDAHTGQQQLWETSVAQPAIVKQYQDLLLVESYSSQYPNAPTINEYLKDCSAFDSTNIAALDINDGTLQWQYKYSGAASSSGFLVNDNVLYIFGTGDHGISWSYVGVDVQTGQIEKRDCSKWPWEHKSIPDYPPDESQEIMTDRHWVFSEREVKVGDNYKQVPIFTEGDTLNIFADNGKITTLTFEGTNLQSSEMLIAIIDEIWLVYLQDSNQLFAFEFDEPPAFSQLK